MSAQRLLTLLLLLKNGGRMSARELAERLEVSERTILRDLDRLGSSGVPVYAVRGSRGGFELLDTYDHEVPALPAGIATPSGRLRRVRVRLSPTALQLALVLGRPDGWRPRPGAAAGPRLDGGRDQDRPGWVEGSFRFSSYDAAAAELLALGSDVEVLLPVEVRRAMAERGRRIAELHA